MKLIFIIYLFTVVTAVHVPLTWQVGTKSNNEQQNNFPVQSSYAINNVDNNPTATQGGLTSSKTTNNGWLPVLLPTNIAQIETTPKYIQKKKPHIRLKKVPPKFQRNNKKYYNSKNLVHPKTQKKLIFNPFTLHHQEITTSNVKNIPPITKHPLNKIKHFQTRNVKGDYPQVYSQSPSTSFLVPFDFNPNNPFTQDANEQTAQQIQVFPQITNFNTFATIPSSANLDFNPFVQSNPNPKTVVLKPTYPSQLPLNLAQASPNFDFDTKNPFNKNYRDDKTHEPARFDRYYDRESIPKIIRKEHERAPISIHEQPLDVPTRPIYPGTGKWAKQGIKHKPFISKQQYTNIDPSQERPDGHDVFETNEKLFENQKSQFGHKLREFPEKHQRGGLFNNKIRSNNGISNLRNIEDLNAEKKIEEKEEEEEDVFVPERLYAQVRHSEDKKHLPPEAAEEERLKEIIKDSKVQTVYSEEGYEDSAYDHAGHEKLAESDEEYAKKQKKEEEKQEKNEPSKKYNLHLPERESTSYVKENIKIDEDKNEKLSFEDDEDDDSESAGTQQEDESKLSTLREQNIEPSEKSINSSITPNKESEKLSTTIDGNGNTELEISSEVKIIRQPNNSTKSHKYVKIYPKNHNSLKNGSNQNKSVSNKQVNNKTLDIITPTTQAYRDISDAFDVEIPATTQATTAIPKIKVAFLDLTNINPPKLARTTKSSFLESSHRKRRRKRTADTASEINIDTDFIDDIKHELGTPTQPPDLSIKYPYYKNYKEMGIPEDSALRYSEDLTKVPVKTVSKLAFYGQADIKMSCGEVNPEVEPVPERVNDGSKPSEEEDVKKGPRLGQLGDKIDCFKAKYFGENPLDNPFFQEEVVGPVESIFDLKTVPEGKKENARGEKIKNAQEISSSSNRNEKVLALDSDLVQNPTDYEENEVDYDSDKNIYSLKKFLTENFLEKEPEPKYVKNADTIKNDATESDTSGNKISLNNIEKIVEILATEPSISLLTTPKYTIDLKPKHIYDQIELLGYLPDEEGLDRHNKLITEIPNNNLTDIPDRKLKKNEKNVESSTKPPTIEKNIESPIFHGKEEFDFPENPLKKFFDDPKIEKDFESPKVNTHEEFDSPIKTNEKELEQSPKFKSNENPDLRKEDEKLEKLKFEFDQPITPLVIDGFAIPKLDQYEEDFDISKFYRSENEGQHKEPNGEVGNKNGIKVETKENEDDKNNTKLNVEDNINEDLKENKNDDEDAEIKEKIIDEVRKIQNTLKDQVKKDYESSSKQIIEEEVEESDKKTTQGSSSLKQNPEYDKNTRQAKILSDKNKNINLGTDVTTPENLPDAEALNRFQRRKPMLQIFDVNRFLPTRRPIDYKSITYPTSTARTIINPNVFRRKGPLYQIFDVNKFLPTTPYPLFKNIITLSTVLPKYKVLSEVFYKDDIKPSEQINVFTDIINNIKNATKKLFRDSLPQGSETATITVINPNKIKNKRTEENQEFGNHADSYRNIYEHVEENYFSTTDVPLDNSNSEEIENVTSFESTKSRKRKRRRRIKTTTSTTQKVPEVIEETTQYQDELANVIGLLPPKSTKYKTIMEKDIPYNINHEIEEEKILNKYLVLGMKPPPKQIFHTYLDYTLDNHIKRRRTKPRRAKRSAVRPSYTGLSRNRGQQPITEASNPKKEEDDDYVPHRPKNYHYDEKTGKIIYDKVEKPAEEDLSEEIVYVEVEEEKPQTTAKPKQNPIFATATPPPPGESFTDFVKLLKSASNYREIPDPTTTEKGKEATTVKEETTTLKPVSTTPPEFLSILAKVRSDTNYKPIEDKKKTKASTTTTETPIEEEEDQSQIENIKNSPGGVTQVAANLGIFDITDFLPKVKTYVPKTAIDTSKYKTIQRMSSPSTTVKSVDTSENTNESITNENTVTTSTIVANSKDTTTTEKPKTKATHSRRRLSTLRSSKTTIATSPADSESNTQDKTRRPQRRRRLKTTPAPTDKTVTEVVDSSTKVVRRRSERDSRTFQNDNLNIESPKILSRVDRVDPQYEHINLNDKANVRQIYDSDPINNPEVIGNYRNYYLQDNVRIVPSLHYASNNEEGKNNPNYSGSTNDLTVLKNVEKETDKEKKKQNYKSLETKKLEKDVEIYKNYDKTKTHGGNYRYDEDKLLQETQQGKVNTGDSEVIGIYDKNKVHGGNYKYEDELVRNNEQISAENSFNKKENIEDIANNPGREDKKSRDDIKEVTDIVKEKSLLDSTGNKKLMDIDIFSEYDKHKKHGGNYKYQSEENEDKREKRIDKITSLPTLQENVDVSKNYDETKQNGGDYKRENDKIDHKELSPEEIHIQSVYFNDYKRNKVPDEYKRHNDKKRRGGYLDKDQQKEYIENSKVYQRLLDDSAQKSKSFYGDPKLPGAINSLLEVVDLTSEELEEIVTSAEVQLSDEDKHGTESGEDVTQTANERQWKAELEKPENDVTSENPKEQDFVTDDVQIVFSEAGKIVPTLKPVAYIKDPSKRLYYYAPIK